MKSSAQDRELKWPELAGDCFRPPAAAKAAVLPIVGERGEPCFAVTVDQRWLCGSEGDLALFDSVAAASRFLQLVKVPIHRLLFGPAQVLDRYWGKRRQCYRLAGQGLASCSQCRIGEQSRAREVDEFARQDDCW